MSIRRRSTPRPALRHVSFLETMATCVPDDERHRAAQAAFLTLRLFDDRMSFGAQVAAPTSRALAATRDGIARLDVSELSELLAATTDATSQLTDGDPLPVLSPLFTLGALLESRGNLAHAGDVFLTVARHADSTTHRVLAFESRMRAGENLRRVGDCDRADQAFGQAVRLATRDGDRSRVLLAKLGRAKVLWARGDLENADAAIDELMAEAEEARSSAITSRLLHERATLAWVRGECDTAVRCALSALDLAAHEQDRDAILTALACYLEALEAPDAAQAARGAIAGALRTRLAEVGT